MKRVVQAHVTGCGIACAAMILNKPYHKAFERFSNYVKTRLNDLKGTSVYDIQYALRGYAKLPDRPTPFRGKFPEKNALFVMNRNGGSWHWVVWDAQKQRILDPSWKADRKISQALLNVVEGEDKLNSYYEITYI